MEKKNPGTGEILTMVAKGGKTELDIAIKHAKKAFEIWSNWSVVNRAEILRKASILIQEKKQEITEIVHLETGKSRKDASSETNGVIELGFFMAGEGRRYYGQTTSSAVENRSAMTIRQPVGICGLIVPFNTPIANVAWKSFPALLCGNAVIIKASKDTPYTPIWFAKILMQAGLPRGIFSVLQGNGEELGREIVNNHNIDLISFTGSGETGKSIQQNAGSRLAKVSLELGGKNALVVCEDADLDEAVTQVVLSAFSNAGQRCAAGSRIIVFAPIYEKFKKLLLRKISKLKIGSDDSDDFGPVINEIQLLKIQNEIIRSVTNENVKILSGGYRLKDQKHHKGYFFSPTLLENVNPNSELSKEELFGPVTALYKVKDFNEAVEIVNNSPYGLTAAIHTKNFHRVQEFINKVKCGVISINGATYGSEPHLPFGGLKSSGNGFREPGTQALDVYSEWKTVYLKYDPKKV
jgi:alpha-ketoglutaric semialdehyde dehydrogenase